MKPDRRLARGEELLLIDAWQRDTDMRSVHLMETLLANRQLAATRGELSFADGLAVALVEHHTSVEFTLLDAERIDEERTILLCALAHCFEVGAQNARRLEHLHGSL